MRSSLSSLRRQRVVGYTAGNLAAVSECFFFLPTRVGSGGSHFLGGSFFCGQAHRSHAHTHLVVLVWAAPRCTTRDLSLSVSADRNQRTMMCKRGLGQVAEAARRPKGASHVARSLSRGGTKASSIWSPSLSLAAASGTVRH